MILKKLLPTLLLSLLFTLYTYAQEEVNSTLTEKVEKPNVTPEKKSEKSSGYRIKNLKSNSWIADGMPLKQESFKLTPEEQNKTSDLVVVRTALSREQNRLVHLYVHQAKNLEFLNFVEKENFAKQVSREYDSVLEHFKNMDEINSFTFDSFRRSLYYMSVNKALEKNSKPQKTTDLVLKYLNDKFLRYLSIANFLLILGILVKMTV